MWALHDPENAIPLSENHIYLFVLLEQEPFVRLVVFDLPFWNFDDILLQETEESKCVVMCFDRCSIYGDQRGRIHGAVESLDVNVQ